MCEDLGGVVVSSCRRALVVLLLLVSEKRRGRDCVRKGQGGFLGEMTRSGKRQDYPHLSNHVLAMVDWLEKRKITNLRDANCL